MKKHLHVLPGILSMLLMFGSCGGEYVDQVYAPLGPPAAGTTTTPPAPLPGDTWTVQNSTVTNNFYGAAVNGTTVVVVGGGPSVLRSTDSGVTWTDVSPAFGADLYDVVWTGSKYVAVGGDLAAPNAYVASSPDGITWTIDYPGVGEQPYRAVAYNSTIPLFVAVGWAGQISTSPDGIAWTPFSSGSIADLRDVVWGNNLFVLTGGLSLIMTSPDGTTWTQRNVDTVGVITGIAWSGSTFVGVGSGSAVAQYRDSWTSADGLTWTKNAGAFDCDTYEIMWSGTRFAAAGIDTTASVASIRLSADGTTWTPGTVPATPITSSINRVVGSDSLFVGVGFGGTIITSP